VNTAARSARAQKRPDRSPGAGPSSIGLSSIGRSSVARATASLAGGALALFHAGLLAERLRDLSIAEPAVLASWLGAAALGTLALYLRRRGLPIASGRSGLAFWLLVLLLHLGLAPAMPATVRAEQLLVLPLEGVAAFVSATAALAALATLATLAAMLRARSRSDRPLLHRARIERPRPLPAHALGSLAARFAPRPPPAR
jgi:hypothetical protein